MPDLLENFPFWILNFDEDGKLRDAAAEQSLADGIDSENLTDLFVFSHGWNKAPSQAKALYRAFFGEVRKLMDDPALTPRRQARIGVCGVIWPSVFWPDESPVNVTGGAAGMEPGASDPFTE